MSCRETYDFRNYVAYTALLSTYEEKLAQWLATEMSEMMNECGDVCVDNFRIAEVGNREEEEKYNKAYAKGCCGEIDKEVVHQPTTRIFKIGLNYGH
jgi:hypothetical protein